MPFDVWLAESCSTINNLSETSRLSKLNCACEEWRLREDVRIFCREQKGPIRIVFWSGAEKPKCVCIDVCVKGRERERAREAGCSSYISLAPSSGKSEYTAISQLKIHMETSVWICSCLYENMFTFSFINKINEDITGSNETDSQLHFLRIWSSHFLQWWALMSTNWQNVLEHPSCVTQFFTIIY